MWTDPKNKDAGVPMLIGITSWSGACGMDEWPSVFGRVTQALDWIKLKTRKYSQLFKASDS